jgi:hypothetical protein
MFRDSTEHTAALVPLWWQAKTKAAETFSGDTEHCFPVHRIQHTDKNIYVESKKGVGVMFDKCVEVKACGWSAEWRWCAPKASRKQIFCIQ